MRLLSLQFLQAFLQMDSFPSDTCCSLYFNIISSERVLTSEWPDHGGGGGEHSSYLFTECPSSESVSDSPQSMISIFLWNKNQPKLPRHILLCQTFPFSFIWMTAYELCPQLVPLEQCCLYFQIGFRYFHNRYRISKCSSTWQDVPAKLSPSRTFSNGKIRGNMKLAALMALGKAQVW